MIWKYSAKSAGLWFPAITFNLIRCYRRRLNAVSLAKGGSTKYFAVILARGFVKNYYFLLMIFFLE